MFRSDAFSICAFFAFGPSRHQPPPLSSGGLTVSGAISSHMASRTTALGSWSSSSRCMATGWSDIFHDLRGGPFRQSRVQWPGRFFVVSAPDNCPRCLSGFCLYLRLGFVSSSFLSLGFLRPSSASHLLCQRSASSRPPWYLSRLL